MGPVMLNLTRQTIPSLHTYYSWLNTTRATTRFPNSRYKTCLETKNMAYIITRRLSAYPQKPAGSTSSYTRPLPILPLKRCIQLHKRTKPKEQTLKIDRSQTLLTKERERKRNSKRSQTKKKIKKKKI